METPVAIVPNAGIDVSTTPQSRAAVAGTTFPASTNSVFGTTAYSGSAAPTDWTKGTYINNVNVNSGAASLLALATAQYYPANGDKVYFYAYAPTVASITTAAGAAVASYTTTGQEDIMAAQVVTGIAKNPVVASQAQPAFQFAHKLTQLKFKLVADATFETGKKVTSIKVLGVKNVVSLNIGTGVAAFSGSADLSLPIVANTNDGITTSGTTMDGCVMCEPTAAITLSLVADGVTFSNITVSGLSTTEGNSHLITLTFKRNAIVPTAAITQWTEGGGKVADVI